jgi:uncharacterized protein (DUF305 family)
MTMIADGEVQLGTGAERVVRGRRLRQWRAPLLAALALALATTTATAAWVAWPRTPGDASVDAGFLRDMVAHHRQAVEMAMTVYPKTQDEDVRLLATDIALTQQAQVGMMEGWLRSWDLGLTGPDPAMAWMGHPVEGRMPGMASPEELARLRELPPAEADDLFLALMIRHHVAGVEMAEAILERGDQPLVEELARNIVGMQQGEIDAMRQMRAARGLPPVPASGAMPGMDHSVPMGGTATPAEAG